MAWHGMLAVAHLLAKLRRHLVEPIPSLDTARQGGMSTAGEMICQWWGAEFRSHAGMSPLQSGMHKRGRFVDFGLVAPRTGNRWKRPTR